MNIVSSISFVVLPLQAAKGSKVAKRQNNGTPITVPGMHFEAPKASKSMLKGSVYPCTMFQPNPAVRQGAIKFPPLISQKTTFFAIWANFDRPFLENGKELSGDPNTLGVPKVLAAKP